MIDPIELTNLPAELGFDIADDDPFRSLLIIAPTYQPPFRVTEAPPRGDELARGGPRRNEAVAGERRRPPQRLGGVRVGYICEN